MTPYDLNIASPVGWLGLRLSENGISALDIHSTQQPTRKEQPEALEQVVQEVESALQSYFRTGELPLDLPLMPEGTPFQRSVWQQLLEIPDGETRTYGQIAQSLGSAPRAVGGACRRNPIPILIPCHRVVTADARIGGYAGSVSGPLVEIKQRLLALEGIQLS